MPELPEVETVRRSLEPHLIGRRVLHTEARDVRLRGGLVGADWTRLEGAVIGTLVRRGKYLILAGEETSAVFHLGMSGRLSLALPEAPRAPHTHLVVHMDSGRELRFVDPRRFGSALIRPTAHLHVVPPLATIGVEPLEDSARLFLREAAARTRVPIRNVLLDQAILAGVGNIYANEALGRARIDPRRPARELSGRRIDRLAAAVREVLEAAIAAGGTTLADGGFADASGAEGKFAVDLAVYGREDEPCRRCGQPIRRVVLSGRSAYFCPACQR